MQQPAEAAETLTTSTFKTVATVKRGGLIEVRSDQFSEGTTVEVIVLGEEEKAQAKDKSGLSHLVGINKSNGSFSSITDIDDYIRQERDSWDS